MKVETDQSRFDTIGQAQIYNGRATTPRSGLERRMRQTIAAVALTLSCTAASAAKWLYNDGIDPKNETPWVALAGFDDDPSGLGFAAKCYRAKADTYVAVGITTGKRFGQGPSLQNVNITLRVDDEAPIAFSAKPVDSRGSTSYITGFSRASDDYIAFFRSLLNMRTRLALAVDDANYREAGEIRAEGMEHKIRDFVIACSMKID